MNILTRALAAALLVAAMPPVLAGVAAPASAHPFGPPPTARISATGSQVTIHYTASPDDWVALGTAKGAFKDPAPQLTGEEKLQRSTAVRDYLLGTITVAQDGKPCPGRLASLVGVTDNGARFSYNCDRPVDELDVTLTALVDLDSNYRNVLIFAPPVEQAQVLFNSQIRTQHVSFSGSTRNTAVIGLALWLTFVVAAGIGVLFTLRMRRRRKAA
ncbi:hypothetical protein Aph01nite_10230 [Acrocarpospora phusangensis]|uniref:Uncharacterized protein n=1 Tax=Acrocarpospora phusangensis TaxID=1070424 RepID=A0A919ULY1_9ACTN|nr:hypothetical protein [Acrocarpospora phusangensis]GIH22713.1 hypothetical protein Aph01nite_10230 [Acrocarpospora phusangensis]